MLEAWLLFEQQHGDAAGVAVVEAKMPKQVCVTFVLSISHVSCADRVSLFACHSSRRSGLLSGRTAPRTAGRSALARLSAPLLYYVV